MDSTPLSIVFTALASLVSVALWIDYFRRIDVFEKEKVGPLLLALLIGGFAPFVSLEFYSIMHKAGIRETGTWVHELFYAVFVIGLNEELCKLLGVAVVFYVFRKRIDEPIDYLIYAGVTALGFSMVENFYYFMNHGVRIITSRAFYSALEHIINTSIIVYGVYRKQLFGKGNQLLNSALAFAIAVSSHAMFDFFLREGISGYFTAVFSIIIYLVGINFWVQMLNNANNYSAYFDYDKVPFSPLIVYRLLLWYVLTIVIAFVNNFLAGGLNFAFLTLGLSFISDGFLFFIVILRVSRFKILKNNYLKVRLAFPFYFTGNNDEDFRIPFIRVPFKIRGENAREHHLTRFLGRTVEIHHAGNTKKPLVEDETVLVVNKQLLHDDVIVYSIAFVSRKDLDGRSFLLKPRMGPYADIHHTYPVHGLYEWKRPGKDKLREIDFKDLDFVQWVYLKTP